MNYQQPEGRGAESSRLPRRSEEAGGEAWIKNRTYGWVISPASQAASQIPCQHTRLFAADSDRCVTVERDLSDMHPSAENAPTSLIICRETQSCSKPQHTSPLSASSAGLKTSALIWWCNIKTGINWGHLSAGQTSILLSWVTAACRNEGNLGHVLRKNKCCLLPELSMLLQLWDHGSKLEKGLYSHSRMEVTWSLRTSGGRIHEWK